MADPTLWDEPATATPLMSARGVEVWQTKHGQVMVHRSRERSILQSAKRFHAENPHVYRILCELARKWRKRFPDRQVGIGLLFEIARWEHHFVTTGEPLKLNHNYRKFYAHLLMADEPDLANLFHTRKQRG